MKIVSLDEHYRPMFAPILPNGLSEHMGEAGYFALGILEERGERFVPRGVLMAEMTSAMTELKWLYVEPRLRSEGHGSALLEAFVNALWATGEPHALTVLLDEDSAAMYYFLAREFQFMHFGNTTLYETTVERLAAGKLGGMPPSPYVKPLSAVPPHLLKAYSLLPHAQEETGTIDFPIDPKDCLPESLAMVENGRVSGLLLYIREADGSISMPYYYAEGQAPKRIAALLGTSIPLLAAHYPKDTPVRLYTMDRFAEVVAGAAVPPPFPVRMSVLMRPIGFLPPQA